MAIDSEEDRELEELLRESAGAIAPPVGLKEVVKAGTVERLRRERRRAIRIWGASLAAALVVALGLAAFLMQGASVTLADVKAALTGKTWVHVRYDAGQIKEQWKDLATGKFYAVRFNGDVIFVDEVTNTRLVYRKYPESIDEDRPVRYAEGDKPEAWKPRTVWEYLVEGWENSARGADEKSDLQRFDEEVNGRRMTRFDMYREDAMGKRMLFTQMWVDQETRLPVQIRDRLQLALRDEAKKDWQTGVYDFPDKGPASMQELGVPAELKVVKSEPSEFPEDVKKIIEAVKAAQARFLSNYRVVIWREDEAEIDVVWRQGTKTWDARYFNMQPEQMPEKTDRYYLPAPLTAERILEWAKGQTAVGVDLSDGEKEYSRLNGVAWDKKEGPRVHVTRFNTFSLLNDECRPEGFQWPLWNMGGPAEVLHESDEQPAGTVCVRFGAGSRRSDYYLDVERDYVCVKRVFWEKRQEKWQKSREYWLEQFHRVGGQWAAGVQMMMDYGDESRKISRNTVISRIDVKEVKDGEYPEGIFDPQKVLKGAKVEGY